MTKRRQPTGDSCEKNLTVCPRSISRRARFNFSRYLCVRWRSLAGARNRGRVEYCTISYCIRRGYSAEKVDGDVLITGHSRSAFFPAGGARFPPSGGKA